MSALQYQLDPCLNLSVNSYEYQVDWSEDEMVWVASVVEFPALSIQDENADIALAQLKKLVGDILVEMQDTGDAVPRLRIEQ